MFMDFATRRNNVLETNKILGFSLLAVHRNHYLGEDVTQPTEKLTFQFYRTRDSDSENYRPELDRATLYEIVCFINSKQRPVCLISHNGNRFDFPVFKLKLETLDVSLGEGVMCADSLCGFRYIERNRNWRSRSIDGPSTSTETRNQNLQRQNKTTPVKKYTTIDGFVTKTPRRGVSRIQHTISTISNPYALNQIYKRTVENSNLRAHPPENDNRIMFEISKRFGSFFVNWVYENQRSFDTVIAEDVAIKRKYEYD